jgi:molybdopterin converting factor small subunit
MVDLAIEYDDENLLLVANGQVATPHYVLEDGDEIHLIPAISGG